VMHSTRHAPGWRYASFMLGYCAWRFIVEFIKPPWGEAAAAGSTPVALHAGLTSIQWAAIAGAAYFAYRVNKLRI
jgi:prolipoprotein diacylglyceryltransferase